MSSLSRQSILLLVVHGLFAVANALSGTYVNVFLWKAKNDYALLGWFALAGQIAGAITFYVAGKWVKEHNKMNSLRLGVATSACFYLSVLAAGKQAVRYVIPLGIIQGTAFGFFWLAFNVVYFEVTGPEDRDRFNGWSGLLGSFSGMIAPWISGMLIARAGGGGGGYRLVFTLSLAVFVVGVIVSFFLKKRKVTGHYDWAYTWKALSRPNTPWRRVFAGLAAQGVREGVFAFIIGVLIYVATKAEAKVGNYWLITSAVGIASYWLFGRLMNKRNRSVAMLIGVVLMVAAILPFFWKVNYATLLGFGVVVGIAFPLYMIPLTSSVFDLIGRDQDSADRCVEYVVVRELGLNLGRIAGTITFIAVVSQTTSVMAMNVLLLAVGSSPIAAWWLMRIITRRQDEF